MEKLNLTKQQGEQIAALREEGLALRLEVEARRIAWEAAEQREKAVEQAAIMAKVFTYADDYEDENGNRKGERITDPADAWNMGEEVFMREYLPIVQSKWRELYGLEYPLNYSPTFTEYRRPYLDAQKEYRKIAVRFLRIVGHDKEADEMEKALNGYMRESLAQRLDEVNDRFIIGYAEAVKRRGRLNSRTSGWCEGSQMKKAIYFETYGGKDYFRDKYGNIYTICDGTPAFCSNLKRGNLTDDKAEPSYPVDDVELVYNA